MSFHGGFLGCVVAVMWFAQPQRHLDPVARRHHHRGRPDRAVPRAARQFHQQRAVGRVDRSEPALGDGVSQWRPAAAAPSEPALRGGARRYFAVHGAGGDDPDGRAEAARPDPRQFHRDLCAGPHHRRIVPRARPAAWLPVGRPDHGHAAVGADDYCGTYPYCAGMAQDAIARIEARSGNASDRIFAAAERDQETDQVVRPDAGLALHGAVPAASAARLLRLARSARARGRFHHRAGSQPDVRRAARPVGGLGVAGDRLSRRCCGWSNSAPAAAP